MSWHEKNCDDRKRDFSAEKYENNTTFVDSILIVVDDNPTDVDATKSGQVKTRKFKLFCTYKTSLLWFALHDPGQNDVIVSRTYSTSHIL